MKSCLMFAPAPPGMIRSSSSHFKRSNSCLPSAGDTSMGCERQCSLVPKGPTSLPTGLASRFRRFLEKVGDGEWK